MKIKNDERGSFPVVANVIAYVVIGALIWIIFNEMVMVSFSHFQSGSHASSLGGTGDIMLFVWRLIPLLLLIFAVIWGIVVSHRQSHPLGVG